MIKDWALDCTMHIKLQPGEDKTHFQFLNIEVLAQISYARTREMSKSRVYIYQMLTKFVCE